MKSLSLLFSVCLGFTYQSSLAQNRPLNVIRPLATSSLPSYRYDDYDIEKYERLNRDAESRLRESQRRYEIVNRDYSQSVENEKKIQQSLQSQGRRLEVLRRDIKELEKAIQEGQQSIIQSEQAIPRLQNEVNSLEGQVSSTQKVIEDLKSRQAQAVTDTEKKELEQQINSQNQVLNNLNNQLSQKKKDLTQAQNRLQEARSQLAQNSQKLDQSKREEQSVQSQISDLQRKEEVAHRESMERKKALDVAHSEVQSRSREVEFTQRNVDSVRRNIQVAGKILEDQGAEQGALDGQHEGREIGMDRGAHDGRHQGTSDGRAKGIQDGRQRDYDAGYARGQARATDDALKNSEKEAQANGARDGLNQGKIDGLKNAYNVGLEEGLKHGAETGSDREAYAEGRKNGEAAGLAQAIEDAKPQEPLGYQEKESEYLKAPLKKVIVGDQNLAQKFEGLQGRYSDEGDDRYYRPQPGVLPHPRLERFYVDSYDRSYRQELGQMYRYTYRQEFDASYSSWYRRLYDENFNMKYSDSEKSGYDQAYRDTYQPQYDANYRVRYAVVYKANYDTNYDRYKLDASEKARGFKDGNRTASKAKGYDEGYHANYAANIEIEKRKAYAAGVQRAKNLYDNNPVIQVTSIELKEVDADGIYRPGEGLSVVMKLKNFGLKVKADLASELIEASGGIQIQQSRVITGAIPAQSDAIVVVPIQSHVSSSADDGSQLAVTVRASTGSEVHRADRLSLNIQYPTQVKVIDFDGILIPGKPTSVKVRVYNRSRSVQNLKLSLSVDNSKVDASATQLSAQELAPLTSRDLQLVLTGQEKARFEESPLEIKTHQGSLVFAMVEKKVLTIIRRHSPTEDSKGLILSHNLAVGAGKKLFALDKMDTWDLRVDGAITQAESLSPYKSKIVHILADSTDSVDAATVASIKKFIDQNGSVIIWGGQLNRSRLAQSILDQLDVAVIQNQIINGTVSGIEKLRGLSINYRGDASILRHNNQKGSYALNSNVGVPGVVVFGNGIDEKTAQVVVIGLDMLGLEDGTVRSLIAQTDIMRASFDEKMKLAGSQPSQNMHLVVQGMIDEMLAAELLGTGNFYKNNSEKNKLYRASRKMINDHGRDSSQARELAKSYPLLVETIKKRLSREQWRAELVLEKRHGGFFTSRNLKDIFCSHNSSHNLCQSQVGY